MARSIKHKDFLQSDTLIFGTLMHEYTAVIRAEQGVECLHVPEVNKVYLVPAGVSLDPSVYGTEVDILVRAVTDEVILERGPDDYTEQELENNSNILAIDTWDEVESLLDELKLQEISKNSKAISTALAGLVLSGVGLWLWRSGFMYPAVCLAAVPLGLLISVFGGLRYVLRMIRRLKSDIITDAYGNWVNVRSGKSSINGGMTFNTESRRYSNG